MVQAVVTTLWYNIGIISPTHGHNERGTENLVTTWAALVRIFVVEKHIDKMLARLDLNSYTMKDDLKQ